MIFTFINFSSFGTFLQSTKCSYKPRFAIANMSVTLYFYQVLAGFSTLNFFCAATAYTPVLAVQLSHSTPVFHSDYTSCNLEVKIEKQSFNSEKFI